VPEWPTRKRKPNSQKANIDREYLAGRTISQLPMVRQPDGGSALEATLNQD
jgi:hypothetical protein